MNLNLPGRKFSAASSNSTPSMSNPAQQLTAFQLAWKHYVEEELPKKKSKKKFIVRCLTDPDSPTPEIINDTIKEVEQTHADRLSRRWIGRYLSPIVETLKDYNDIISTCTSADPMPSAIIWGSLKILLNGLDRFHNLFETIGQTLTKLRTQIKRINAYDNLYGEDAEMQTLLYQTYVDVIRFWVRVDKECDRCVYHTLFRATVPFSTQKLNTIVNDIKESVNNIEKQATIVEGLFQKEDRKESTIEREAQAKEREMQDKFREEQRERLHYERLVNVGNWLGSAEANSQNYERHERNLRLRMEGTFQWLAKDPTFTKWLNGTSSSSILWIHSPPGAGKSILCSHVIDLIQKSKDPVIFHFYDFAQDCKAIEAMRLLTHQLLMHYKTGPRDKILEDLCKVAQLEPCYQGNIQNMLKTLAEGLPKVYFVVDGLDESEESILVLEFLIEIASTHPDTVYLWCSSQDRPPIRERLHMFPTLDISNCVEQDIISYLASCLHQSGKMSTSVSQSDQVTDLAKRAQCNFLWASLMIRHIKEIASSPADVQEVIDSGLPDNLYGYYRRIFERISMVHRPICSKIFSLVAFAKRPLRLEELREAIGLLQAKVLAVLTTDDLPYTNTLLGHLSPLIEVTEAKGEHSDRFCRLFHSTVHNFLAENPGVFRLRTDNAPIHDLDITPYTAANACLLYLSQVRYKTLLVREETGAWKDNLGDAVDSQNFLLYAAKYWDRHLDELTYSDKLQDRVVSFIRSSNFRTCIQVQSLWVDSQFSVFQVFPHDNAFQFLRRVFPRWLVETTVGRRLWCEYRQFLHEWKYFLNCQDCGNRGDSDCSTLPCIGDINRCWWTALGPKNFLSGFNGHYFSFIFEESETSETKPALIFEGVSQLGDTVVVLKFMSPLVFEQETADIVCETWSVNGRSVPTRCRRQTIQVTQEVTELRTYMECATHETMRVGMALPAAVDRDCRTLRIGVQIFRRDENGDFGPLPSIIAPESKKYAPYIEEFARRGNIVVVATRTRVISKNYLERRKKPLSESDEEEPSSSSESEPEEEAYESWSEGSTIHSGSDSLPYDDDEAGPWDNRVSDEESESEQEGAGSPSSEPSDTGADSSSDDPEVDPEAILGYGRLREEEDYDWNDESGSESDGFLVRKAKNKRRERLDEKLKHIPDHENRASIRVFDAGPSIPTPLFYLTRPLAFKLYDSPPVIHPTASLVVWPLHGGDILFADFTNNSYFTRRLRPSTYHTRHIFMKCQFSVCGRFLHIAGLEAQAISSPKKPAPEQADSARLPLKLALLVSSYQLSASKTASSPPDLIHRVRIDLGQTSLLSVTKLPYTLSWTPKELHFTISDYKLRVYRIQLFKPRGAAEKEQETPVLIPRKPIFLPETAQTRQVYYFPARVENDARVIIGGETRETCEFTEIMQFVLQAKQNERKARPVENIVEAQGDCAGPVGCYINEQDLGGWRNPSDLSEIPQYMGVGCLSHRIEKFNPDDDCDLEPYIY